MKEVEALGQVGIGRGQLFAHGSSFGLKVVLQIEREVVVNEDELGGLDKGLNEWKLMGGVFFKKVFPDRPWGWRMLVFREVTSTIAMMVLEGEKWGGTV